MAELDLKLENSYASYIDGTITFAGILIKYNQQISNNWHANSTLKQYANEYAKLIIPSLPNKPLVSLTREDFEQAKETIEKESRSGKFTPLRSRHFFYLINLVLDVAEKNGVCPNILKTDPDNIPPSSVKASEYQKNLKIRRCLSAEEEVLASKALLLDETVRGEYIAMSIMYVCGLRPAEACGLNYGDFWEFPSHPGRYYFIISKTSSRTLNSLNAGGKTPNAPRKVPVPRDLAELLLKRKAWVLSQLQPEEDIHKVPIVCVRNELTKRANTTAIDRAGESFFQEIKIDAEKLAFTRYMLRQENDDSLEERDATPYILRRNFATKMKVIGLSKGETLYLMGHDLSGQWESKHSLNLESNLIMLLDKMERRLFAHKPSALIPQQKMYIPCNMLESYETYGAFEVCIDSTVDECILTYEPALLGQKVNVEFDFDEKDFEMILISLPGKTADGVSPASSSYARVFRKVAAKQNKEMEKLVTDDQKNKPSGN